MRRHVRTPLVLAFAPLPALALSAILSIAPATLPAFADEGMWTFDDFPVEAVKGKYGFEADDAWLDKVRLASARFGRGCSASFVSPEGLVMTNHHCASKCIQELSTAEQDHIKDGFYAKALSEEIRCPEVQVRQLLAIRDVTDQIQGATKGLSGGDYNRAQKAAMGRIETECSEGDRFQCEVVSLYHGGLHHLYKYRRYSDVRLVFAPESAIASFGGDPDNFNFPRYDVDLTFVRVYEDGKPVSTKDYFRWSHAGAKQGDLAFVSGNPGKTDRLLTVSQLEYLRDVRYPNRLIGLAELRGLLTQFGKTGPEQRRISQNELLRTENSLKAGRGQLEALLDDDLLAAKVRAEEALRARVAADPDQQTEHGAAWDAIAKAQIVMTRIYHPYQIIEKADGFDGRLFEIARKLVRGAEERPKPSGERLQEFRDSALRSLEQNLFSTAPIYPQLEMTLLEFSLTKLRENLGADDPFVKKVLGKESPEEVARALVEGTRLADVDLRRRLWDGGAQAIERSDDAMVRFARMVDPDARAVRKIYEDEVEAVEKENSELIAKRIFEEIGTSVYPDATSTARLSYGTVKGWTLDGVTVPPFTTLAGLYERATGRDPFALPGSWIEAKARLDLDTPMDFVLDCDIIGGNSGSPVLNRDAEIVGLVFDGNIHSLSGAFWFDERLNRTVAVHSSAILEALEKVYRADRIVRELRPPR